MARQVFESFILGAVQGLTEFLPVSSSGHLVLLEHLLKVNFDKLSFNIIVHLATLLAVLIFTFSTIVEMLKGAVAELRERKFGRNLSDILYLLLATLITGVVALFFRKSEEALTSVYVASFGFLITSVFMVGLWLLSSGRVAFISSRGNNTLENWRESMNLKSSILSGFLQGIAVLPGVSRSGSTIFGLVASGVKPEKAVRYSFLLSIPIILGAALFELLEGGFASLPVHVVVVGFVSAFAFSMVALTLLVKVALKNLWLYFGLYTLALGLFNLFLNYFTLLKYHSVVSGGF